MLYVITGPPAAGKSTWVKQHAKHGDITIDFDELANALTPPGDQPHTYPHHVRTVVHAARKAAIDTALRTTHAVDTYIIHSTPPDQWMKRYSRLNAEVITIDPGRDVVYERCTQQRPARMLEVARDWYAEQDYVPF